MAEQYGGTLSYQVEIDTAKMLTGSRRASDVLGEMEKQSGKADASLSKLEKQAGTTSSTLGALSRVATAVTAALSFREVMAYADAWTTLNNKLANAVRENESLADVTERVFQITQATRSSLNGTATLYARLERATREYNTSATDLAKLTTIINQGFVVSGATAQEAEGAIVQLSQGLASGVLRGQEYNSVAEQGSRLSIALADSLGVSIGQLRAMAAQGKLTTDVVVKGLLSQGDAIGREFAKTTMTIGQASQIAGNNITKFIGSSATVKTGVMVFNDAIITLSENLTSVSNVILAISAVIGSRYVSALTAATLATVANTVAATRAAIAQGSLRAALVAALTPLGGLVGAATLASAAIFYFYQRAQQAKQEAIDFADKLDGVIAKMRTMSSVQLAAEIDKASKSIKLQSEELKGSEAQLTDLTSRLENAKAAVAGLAQNNLLYSDAVSKLNQLESEHIQLTAQVESEQTKLSQTISKTGILRAQMNGTFQQGIDLLKRDGHEAGVSSGLFNQLGDALNFASRAKDKFNSTSLKVERPKNVQDYLDKLNDQVEIQSELNERKRSQLKAEKDIRNLGGSEQDVMLARERAGVEYDRTKAIQEQKQATKENTAEGKKAANQAESVAQKLASLKQQSELAAGSTQELTREQAILVAQQSLGKGATQEQIRLAGQYRAEIWDTAAALKAQNSVPELKENTDYANKKSQLEMLKGAKDDQGNLLISQKQYNQQSEQLEQEHQVALAQIRAGQAVTPQQEAAGSVDPVQALANENAKKLALIQQFETNGTLTHQQAIALRAAADRQYETERVNAQWALFTQQSIGYEALGAAVDSFGQGASSALSGIITGTQSASDAMRGLADTVLSSVIQTFVEMGLQQAKSAIMGASVQQSAIAATTATQIGALGTTTAASVTSAGTTMAAWLPAALVASVGSFGAAAIIGGAALVGAFALSKTLSGKRKNGGPVSAGGMYQIGEGGKPEILQSSNGRNYLLPGDSGGNVLSNKQINSGGGGGTTIIIENYSSGAGVQDTQTSTGIDGREVTRIVLADLQQGGQISQGLSQYHQAPRRATE
ncbi:tape measure protein [Serratia proteamaculans]|uniref:tape measure protein n=1 Tax=Serratia proteamaculans TaxID=28151 RepID=UPI003D03EBB4